MTPQLPPLPALRLARPPTRAAFPVPCARPRLLLRTSLTLRPALPVPRPPPLWPSPARPLWSWVRFWLVCSFCSSESTCKWNHVVPLLLWLIPLGIMTSRSVRVIANGSRFVNGRVCAACRGLTGVRPLFGSRLTWFYTPGCRSERQESQCRYRTKTSLLLAPSL